MILPERYILYSRPSVEPRTLRYRRAITTVIAVWSSMASVVPAASGGIIRCTGQRASTPIINKGTWNRIRTVLLSHDKKLVGPLISPHGLACRSVWRAERRREVSEYHLSKKDLLVSIDRGVFRDDPAVFEGDVDRAYAWLWVALHEKGYRLRVGRNTCSLGTYTQGKFTEHARVAFCCEQGILRIKEMSAEVSGD